MEIAWGRLAPVILSILIILLVAILREHSRTLASIVATMPINIPLALWIVASGDGSAAGLPAFAQALFINIWPTVVFLLVAWLAARAGWGLLPVVIAGYVGWGASLGIVLLVRQGLGI